MAQRNIIKAEFAFQEVLKFEPQKIAVTSPEVIEELSKRKESRQDFQIADVVRNFTGLAELEVQRMESAIEKRALDELKTIQEQAYNEAFELGMSEGRRQAFMAKSEEIDQRLSELGELVASMRESSKHFYNNNENQILKMIFFLATRIAFFEISEKSNEAIKEVLKACVNASHSDESVRVTCAPEQIDFLESLQKEKNRDFEFLRTVEFSPLQGIRPGGCIITTNYSEVDARLEERINKLWEEIKGSIPPLRDSFNHE